VKKGVIFTVALAVIAFTSVGMWGDILKAGPSLSGFPWYLVPLIALFGFCNDLIKFFRWHVYLKKTGILIPVKKSLAIFLAGLSMSATPGKAGLLIKSQMLKRISGHTLISTSPIIAAELYMDLIGLSLISLFGIGLLGKGVWVAILLCMLPLLGLIPGIPNFIIGLLAKIPMLSGRIIEMRKALDSMFSLFGLKILVLSLSITLIAWTSEGVALNIILRGLGFDMGVVTATVFFGFSTLIGVLSMLPGGLVVTDASLMALLIHAGIPAAPAAIASIMARIFTLWLAVMIGSIFLVIHRNDICGDLKEK
jgi:glycosyltransferase 2 family protein